MRLATLLTILLAAAAPAAAQTEGRFALGGAISMKMAPDSAVDGSTNVSLLWRIGRSKEGFNWDWGLNWYGTDVDGPLPSAPEFKLGELHVRPLMVGYGYTHLIGRTAVKLGALGGYAFTTFKNAEGASDVYRERVGALSLSTDTSNAFVLKPQVSIWHDVNRKVGVNINAGYMIARPELTVSTTLGQEKRRLRADMFQLRVGVVYSVF